MRYMPEIRLGLVLLTLLSCAPPSTDTSSRSVTITPGVGCTLDQAVSATNNPGQTFGSCPVASATMPNIIEIQTGTYARTARLTITRAVEIRGSDCGVNRPIIDMGMSDRAFLVSAANVKLRCMRLLNVCPNGGNCLTAVGGSVPTGGGWYTLVVSGFEASDISVEGGFAQGGCGFGLCSGETLTPATQPLIERVEVSGCAAASGGGGGGLTHVDVTIRDSYFHGNHVRTTGTGGNFRIYGGHLTAINTVFEGGVSEVDNGGNVSVTGAGNQAPNQNPIVFEMIGGALLAGVANGNGGDAFVQAGSDGVGVANTFCPMGACLMILRGVTVDGGTADQPLTWPPGSGGLLATNNTGSRPGVIRLEGATTLVGGTDASNPSFPQTFGLIEDVRQVCGNGSLEGSEQCDDGNTTSGDGCTASCVLEVCGNGILDAGEQCDDGNSSDDDACSTTCVVQHCVWTP